MTTISVERIAVVQNHVIDAVTRTSASSTLPEPEQDRLLAQSCAEACDLLKDWLSDPWWDRTRPSTDAPIKESIPTQQEFAKFLGPALKAALARAAGDGMTVPESLVDEARAKVAATARRFPRMRRKQLFEEAAARVRSLKTEVCELATQVSGTARTATTSPASSGWRRKARRALLKVSGLLPALVLAMASASPHAVAQNTAAWEHAVIRTVDVITVHFLADRADPTVHVTPSRQGPRLR